MRSSKGSHRIVVDNVKYRWRATGNDGYINLGIWTSSNIGPYIHGSFKYHETWIDNRDGSSTSAGDQIVITNKLVRRVIEFAKSAHRYNPNVKGAEVYLGALDNLIKCDDAVRARS